MDLAQCRLVTDDVEGLAAFYARLLAVPTALNEYYVEIEAGAASVGFSRRRFTEHREADCPSAPGAVRRDGIILDSSSTTWTPSTRGSSCSGSTG